MTSSLILFERDHTDGDEILNHIIRVTGDETWVLFANVGTKAQSKQWMHTRSPNKPEMFKQTLSTRKLMAYAFRDRKGVLMVELMQQAFTVTSEVYYETLKKLCRAGHSEQKAWNADIRCSAPP
jgi:hypothetical protein